MSDKIITWNGIEHRMEAEAALRGGDGLILEVTSPELVQELDQATQRTTSDLLAAGGDLDPAELASGVVARMDQYGIVILGLGLLLLLGFALTRNVEVKRTAKTWSFKVSPPHKA
ncbi:MAG: hypothetical protein KC933_26720 [Myxococcales bacterium]|nr:hypothetical protein [Myxococcales bacterium]MCB9649351.1 hypothetical protein [Deltaproteobacteria bacterium]